jgi:hypothetical protein
VLGVAAVVVFWSGVPAVLGGGGAFLGLEGLKAGTGKATATIAIVIGAAAILVGAWAVITG